MDPWNTIFVNAPVWFRKRPSNVAGVEQEPWRQGDPGRHNRAQALANYLYIDGHSATVQKEEAGVTIRDPDNIFELYYDESRELN